MLAGKADWYGGIAIHIVYICCLNDAVFHSHVDFKIKMKTLTTIVDNKTINCRKLKNYAPSAGCCQ